MASPEPYVRRYDFVAYQTLSPNKPVPGQELENEYNAIANSLNATISNLKLIQRDDGSLASDSVGWDQLDPEVIVGVQQPFNWQTNFQYVEGNLVYAPSPNASKIYRALVDHLSGVWDTDLAAGKWELQIDFGHATDEANQAAQDAQQALDDFEDIYLGPHPSRPTTDNDGDPLQLGAIYYDTTDQEMRVWNGTVWQWSGQSATAGVRSWNDRLGDVVLLASDIDAATSADPLAHVDDVVAALNTKLNLTGGTMTGPLRVVAGGPTDSAISRGYVDDADTSLANAISLKIGDAPSNGKQYARKDASWQEFQSPIATDAPQDSKTYGRKDAGWVQVVSGGAQIDDNPLGSPLNGQLWWESDTGALNIWYNDGSSAQWVQTNANGIPDAPLDGKAYSRKNQGWIEVLTKAEDAPSDGGFYAKQNGLWVPVPKYQRFSLAGVRSLDIQVPTGATRARVMGTIIPVSASFFITRLQMSVVAGVFKAGSTDYNINGFSHDTQTTPTAVTNTNNVQDIGFVMASTHANNNLPVIFDGNVTLKRSRSNIAFAGDFRGVSYTSTASICHSFYWSWLNLAAIGTETSVLALRVIGSDAVNVWDTDSFVSVEWM